MIIRRSGRFFTSCSGGEGYEIKEAKSGADALKITKEQQFDLIILDIMMPGMDGYHTCMELIKTVW